MVEFDTIIINGGKPLKGEVTVRGAKNAIPKAMVAALLADEPSELYNVSDVSDVEIVGGMIQSLGGQVENSPQKGELFIDPHNLTQVSEGQMAQFIGQSRIPILFCGPLIHRLGEAIIPKLGGCEIGPRPVDFHLQALQDMGAKVIDEGSLLRLKADRLHGANITLPYPSVGATEQVMLAASRAKGVTRLFNAAIEPEVIDLAHLIQKMGGNIVIDADRRITIEGVDQLNGFKHHAMTDRIEAASWASAALATNGDIFVRGAVQDHMMTFLNIYRKAGGQFEIDNGTGIRFFRKGSLSSVALQTDVHPGFATDWLQPFVVALTQTEGTSPVHETVYENRFGYTEALREMGANIQLSSACMGDLSCRFKYSDHLHSAFVTGPTPLQGADIVVPDLRAGFSYVIAGLTASGTSHIRNSSLINRGYENIPGKLNAIGADFNIQ